MYVHRGILLFASSQIYTISIFPFYFVENKDKPDKKVNKVKIFW